MTKIKIKEITESQVEACRESIDGALDYLVGPTDWGYAYSTLYRILDLNNPDGKKSPHHKLHSNPTSNLNSILYASLNPDLASSLESSLESNLGSGLSSSLDSSLHDSLHSSLYPGLAYSLYSSLNSSLYSTLDDSLHAALDDTLPSNLGSSLDSSLDSSIRDNLNSSLTSSLDYSLHSSLFYSLLSRVASSIYSGLDANLSSNLNSGLAYSLDANLLSSLCSSLHSNHTSSLYSGLKDSLYSSLKDSLPSSLDSSLYSGLDASLSSSIYSSLDSNLNSSLSSSVLSSLYSSLPNLDHSLEPSLSHSLSSKMSYCGVFWLYWHIYYKMGAILGVKFDDEKFQLFEDYCKSGANLLAEIEIQIDGKPCKLPLILPKCQKIKWHKRAGTGAPWFFPIYELHAESESCVEHPCLKEPLYFWHNVAVPAKMGLTKKENWKPGWILEEQNAEIKRILLKEIPTDKIYQELGGKTIDAWQGYKLIELKAELEIKYQYCSMRCPSTGDEYLLRVPPDIKTAHEAITWVNHGIKPEEIYMES